MEKHDQPRPEKTQLPPSVDTAVTSVFISADNYSRFTKGDIKIFHGLKIGVVG